MNLPSRPLPAHPSLPPRPPSSLNANPGGGHPAGGAATPLPAPSPRPPLASPSGLQLPRSSPFFSQPQPASPRTPSHLGSPKLNPASGIASSAHQNHAEAVVLPAPLDPAQLKPTTTTVHWGEGWTVHWRSWSGPALLDVPAHSGAPAAATSTAPARTDAPPATKKARRTAFDDLLDEEDAGLRSPVASTSKAAAAGPPPPPLKSRLQALPSPLASDDPIELARAAVFRQGQEMAKRNKGDWLALVPFVKLGVQVEHTKGKGKGKATEDAPPPSAAVPRSLWVFTLVKPDSPSSATAVLDALDFPELTATGNGRFSHRELYPILYKANPDGSETTYLRPNTLPASGIPSSVQLSAELHTDLGSTNPALHAAYTSFLSALSSSVIASLLADPPSSTPTQPKTTRLSTSILYLPPATLSTSSRPRIPPLASSANFSFSLLSHGLSISPTIASLPIRAFPLGTPPPENTPVLLAPFALTATFVKAYPSSNGDGDSKSKIREMWGKVLEGTGLELEEAGKESWVLCRVAVPAPAPATADSPSGGDVEMEDKETKEEERGGTLDVVWPRSLVLVDGTTASPPVRSPAPTPPRAKAADLPNVSEADSPLTSSERRGSELDGGKPVNVNVNLDAATRRRLAAVVRRGRGDKGAYRDPVKALAEKVGKLLEEVEEQKEKREREEREEKEESERKEREDAAAASASSMPTNGQAGLGGGPDKFGGATSIVGAPINMRTPISLGGSSTEAPSPADGFVPSLVGLPLPPVSMSMEGVYPSPSEAGNASNNFVDRNAGSLNDDMGFNVLGSTSMDNTFSDYNWEDDFGSAPMSMPARGDYDDGMGGMMLLTDDDFSFFDDHPTTTAAAATPTVAPVPPAGINFSSGLQSSGLSPKFVDHFSHLGSSGSPFASAASPTSPFAHHSSPHVMHSPTLNFAFDPNALGLSTGTPAPLVTSYSAGSPFKPKTPRTPFSPFVEILEEDDEAFNVSIAGTPAAPHPFAPPRHSSFEAVQFGNSHGASDDKYDPRKGKFGLPSPPEEVEFAQLPRTPLSGKTWYAVVCDPRVAAAGALKRKRKTVGGSQGQKESGRLSARSWVRNDVESDGDGEAEESEEEEDDEVSLVDGGANRRSSKGDERLIQTNYDAWLDNSFGPALFLLHGHLGVLLQPTPPARRPAVAASKAITAKDMALDATAAVFVDQIVYNPDFRARVVDAQLPRPSTSSLITAPAIQLVDQHLSQFTSTCSTSTTAMPLLTTQTVPTILLRAQQSIMQVRTTAMRFWRPMSFEPLTGRKDVTAFAIFEEGGEELGGAVKAWMQKAGEAYQASRLGRHTPGTAGSIEDGLAVVPAGSLSHTVAKDNFRTLCSHLSEACRVTRHVVVYLLTPPGPLPTSPTSPIALTIQQLVKSKSASMSLVVYPVPISTIADSRTMILGESTANRLDRLAFSVFDQLQIPVSKLHFPVPETFPTAPFNHAVGPAARPFQFPAITLSPIKKPHIEFELAWPSSSLEVMHRHRLLHVGYTVFPVEGESNLEWLVTSVIDERGETWKMVPKLIRCPAGAATEMARAKLVWAIARTVADQADVEWRMVICRLGLMSKIEMKAWHAVLKEQISLTKRAVHVTVACCDPQAPISFAHLRPEFPTTPLPSSRRDVEAEEGEVPRGSSGVSLLPLPKPAHLDTASSFFGFAPTEPTAIGNGPFATLIAPSSTYLIHVPRIASLDQVVDFDPLVSLPSHEAISILGIHILSCHASRASSLTITLGKHTADIRQSFVELSALGQDVVVFPLRYSQAPDLS
ncbi:hypothetical protein MNV49_001062 [Pseudohyphozyma bogoriensis]|nr:hypothetical protein MNV49_001062 [Pseudohyphozyma bogoriensis]